MRGAFLVAGDGDAAQGQLQEVLLRAACPAKRQLRRLAGDRQDPALFIGRKSLGRRNACSRTTCLPGPKTLISSLGFTSVVRRDVPSPRDESSEAAVRDRLDGRNRPPREAPPAVRACSGWLCQDLVGQSLMRPLSPRRATPRWHQPLNDHRAGVPELHTRSSASGPRLARQRWPATPW